MQKQEVATLHASLCSAIITLFINGKDFDAEMRVLELFLLDGEKVLVDLLAGMIIHKRHMILQLHDLELMNFLRIDMI